MLSDTASMQEQQQKYIFLLYGWMISRAVIGQFQVCK